MITKECCGGGYRWHPWLRITVVMGLTLLMGMQGFAAEDSVGEVNQKLREIPARLKDGSITRVDIMHVPANLYPAATITPKWLTNNYRYKLTIRDVVGSRVCEELGQNVAKTKVQSLTGDSDVRWGIIFLGKRENEEFLAIYLDGPGTKAMVGNRYYAVNEVLSAWLGKTFK